MERFSITDSDSILALAGATLPLPLIAYLQIHIGQRGYIITGILAFLPCVAYLVLKWRQNLSNIFSYYKASTRAFGLADELASMLLCLLAKDFNPCACDTVLIRWETQSLLYKVTT